MLGALKPSMREPNSDAQTHLSELGKLKTRVRGMMTRFSREKGLHVGIVYVKTLPLNQKQILHVLKLSKNKFSNKTKTKNSSDGQV